MLTPTKADKYDVDLFEFCREFCSKDKTTHFKAYKAIEYIVNKKKADQREEIAKNLEWSAPISIEEAAAAIRKGKP